jgi:hypothetical protein
MTLHNDWNHGTLIAQAYRDEADTHRLLTLAPRRPTHRPTLARALRALAQRLARAAERFEPTPARPARPWPAAATPTPQHR